VTCWPTLQGSGATLQYISVGILILPAARVTALALGISIIEAVIENVKIAAIKIAIDLPLKFRIFLFLSFYFVSQALCCREISTGRKDSD
jgi:hypothetical protein